MMGEFGLPERLAATGVRVADYGDLPVVRWRPDPHQRRPHNLQAVLGVLRETSMRVGEILADGRVPLVLGGECSVTIAVMSAFLDMGMEPALLRRSPGRARRRPPAGLDPTRAGAAAGGGGRLSHGSAASGSEACRRRSTSPPPAASSSSTWLPPWPTSVGLGALGTLDPWTCKPCYWRDCLRT